ncbi:MAG TPA: hypothetical protein PK198_13220, partial [Saprospiraceae bacterium]|nr:hypothetical protein [Saprospiraceae bacterium]
MRPFFTQTSSVFLTFLFLFAGISAARAQVTVSVVINSGNATTTCTDLLSPPDPMWRVNIENQGWSTYPRIGNCWTALPNTQYTATY